ncbi:MAG: thermonuclease family protein [Candidatus Latescibacterota bacterium]|nr:MAG: thermonuclease family protein [Candidatus Latescibacterota bacterium]
MIRQTNLTRMCRSLLLVVLTTAAVHFTGCSAKKPPGYTPSYRGAKIITVADIEFDDGDTFFLKGKPIRLLGVDTPEIAHPDLGIDEGQPYGDAAAESTRVWLVRAQLIEYVPDGMDRYNRRLAHVFIDGDLLACRLIRNRLAYETVSHYGDSGFPDLAQQILDTARETPKPDFEQPYKWKRKQREKAKQESGTHQ